MRGKGRLSMLLAMLLLVLILPVTASAATTTYKLTSVAKPTTVKVGSSFTLKGKITCSKKLKEVRVTIYNSTGKKCLQRYTARPNSKTYNLTYADPYILFNKLSVGKYYMRILCIPVSGTQKRVVNKQFTVVGNGKIQLANPKPSSNITISKGSNYALGGRITSTYKIKGITAQIINKSTKKAVYSKTSKPNSTSYTLTNSKIDEAMKFNKLAAGSYTLQIKVVDSQGTSAVVMNRTVTVKKASTASSGTNVSTSSTGGATNSGTYLNVSGTVTTPKNFAARTTRPAASNKYYYNKTYNIYYGYNSLAPTGKVYYGKRYVIGNCTWYACGRAMEIVARAGGSISKVQAIFGGDPVGIYKANVTKKMFKYGKTPKIGSLVVFNYGSDGAAHIAVVEKIINGVPYVSESGYKESTTKPNSAKSNIVFQYQSIYNWAGGRSVLGYIYLV
ncbi:MAG: CHAP domain-containing protein [Eubacteriales bacterium]|nr:CHAP domain-containing protein [Eubacteriales bacterium]